MPSTAPPTPSTVSGSARPVEPGDELVGRKAASPRSGIGPSGLLIAFFGGVAAIALAFARRAPGPGRSRSRASCSSR
jgi:hypothetical protein